MSATADPHVDALRALLAGLSDEAIHGVLESIVSGLVHGLADVVVEHAVDSLIEQIGLLDGPDPDPDPEPKPEPVPVAAQPDCAPRNTKQRTCVDCGRIGSRRFIDDAGVWKCSDRPACARRQVGLAPKPASARPDNRPRDPLRAPTLPTPEPDEATRVHPQPPPTEGVTARCQDCPRAFTLTGVVLRHAVELHEYKHSHIVTIYDESAKA